MGYDAWILLMDDACKQLYHDSWYESFTSMHHWFHAHTDEKHQYEYVGKSRMGKEQCRWTLTELEDELSEFICFKDLKQRENFEQDNVMRDANTLLQQSLARRNQKRLKELPDYGSFTQLRKFIESASEDEDDTSDLKELVEVVEKARACGATQIIYGWRLC